MTTTSLIRHASTSYVSATTDITQTSRERPANRVRLPVSTTLFRFALVLHLRFGASCCASDCFESDTLNADAASLSSTLVNPLESRGNYSAISNSMKLVHWPLMGGLLHLVQRGEDWVGPQPAQAPPRCTKCNSPPIQCTNHCIAV